MREMPKLREEIMDVLVRGAVGVQSEDLKNKNWWFERSEEGQVFAFFVLESSEKSVVGVDERLGVNIIERDS